MSDPADRIWHISRRGQPIGPVSALELAWLAKAGHLKPTDFIWCRGLPDWVEAGAVAGLLPTNEPPPPAAHERPIGTNIAAVSPSPPGEKVAEGRMSGFVSRSDAGIPPLTPALSPRGEGEERAEPLNRLKAIHDRFNLGAQDPFAKAAARVARGDVSPRRAAGQPVADEQPAAGAYSSRIAGALDPWQAAPEVNHVVAGSSPAPVQPSSSLTVRAEPPLPAADEDNGAAASWLELGKFDIGRSVSDAIIVALDKFAIRTLDDLAADWRLQSLASDAFDALPGTVRFLINQTVGRSVLEGYILDMLTNLKSRIPPEQRQRDLRSLIRETAASPWLSEKLSAAYAKTRTGLGSLISNYTPSRVIPLSWWSPAAAAAPQSTPLMLTAESAAMARAELL